MKILENKVSIITGASRAGKGHRHALRAGRCRVVLAAAYPQDIEQIAAGLVSQGYAAVTFPCDVSDPLQIEALAISPSIPTGTSMYGSTMPGWQARMERLLTLHRNNFFRSTDEHVWGLLWSSMAMRHFLPRKSGKLINILAQAQRSGSQPECLRFDQSLDPGFLRSHWQPKPKTAGWASSRFSRLDGY